MANGCFDEHWSCYVNFLLLDMKWSITIMKMRQQLLQNWPFSFLIMFLCNLLIIVWNKSGSILFKNNFAGTQTKFQLLYGFFLQLQFLVKNSCFGIAIFFCNNANVQFIHSIYYSVFIAAIFLLPESVHMSDINTSETT